MNNVMILLVVCLCVVGLFYIFGSEEVLVTNPNYSPAQNLAIMEGRFVDVQQSINKLR